MTHPMRLVIDTDTGSDDAVALVMAAQTATVIEAVTTVAGNVPLPQATRNALVTLELAGRPTVPVYEGCDRPLIRPLETAQHVHGPDGMSGVPLPEPANAPAHGNAVDELLRLAAQEGPALTLVTLGPLTNLAAAIVRDRKLLQRFRHTYCMAGAADTAGNVAATAEFNVWADPEAAAIVLQAATPQSVTWVGWDVARRDAVMTRDCQQDLRALGTPLADFADQINQAVNVWATEVTGVAGYDLPDPATVAVALRPEIVRQAETVHVRVALGDEARGQLLIDRRHNAAPANVNLVRRIDRRGFRRMLFEACGANQIESSG